MRWMNCSWRPTTRAVEFFSNTTRYGLCAARWLFLTFNIVAPVVRRKQEDTQEFCAA